MSITKEIVVYASLPAKKYRWISYITCMQIGFLGLNLFVVPTKRLIEEHQKAKAEKSAKKEEIDHGSLPADYRLELEEKDDSAAILERLRKMDYSEIFSYRNFKENLKDRPFLSLGIIVAAFSCSFAFYNYARRTVHMITLLPGDRVRFAFFSPTFSKPPTAEFSLRDVSCIQGRDSHSNYSILKLRNYWGFHLVHKREGQFLEPKLYDKYLGYERVWSTKN